MELLEDVVAVAEGVVEALNLHAEFLHLILIFLMSFTFSLMSLIT